MANNLDMDALLDEVVARKGPYKYKDGFSEENWEEVATAVHDQATQRRVGMHVRGMCSEGLYR